MTTEARPVRAPSERELSDKPAKLRPAIRSAFGMLYDGLLTQLLSTPGDFWINKWLYNEHPSFRPEIERGLSGISGDAHQALRAEIRILTPRRVYQASNAMNAAFAGFIDELFGCDEFAQPYKGTEFEVLGLRLRSHNLSDRGHAGDKKTTDGWAQELGVKGWYEWRTVLR